MIPMNRPEFIEEFTRLVESGEITDIETFMFNNRKSRGKAISDLNKESDFAKVRLGKHNLFIKK